MCDFTQGEEWIAKNEAIFFYSEAHISLNISIESLQSNGMNQLRVMRGLHNFCLGACIFELV